MARLDRKSLQIHPNSTDSTCLAFFFGDDSSLLDGVKLFEPRGLPSGPSHAPLPSVGPIAAPGAARRVAFHILRHVWHMCYSARRQPRGWTSRSHAHLEIRRDERLKAWKVPVFQTRPAPSPPSGPIAQDATVQQVHAALRCQWLLRHQKNKQTSSSIRLN